jgi:hypothetical protein
MVTFSPFKILATLSVRVAMAVKVVVVHPEHHLLVNPVVLAFTSKVRHSLLPNFKMAASSAVGEAAAVVAIGNRMLKTRTAFQCPEAAVGVALVIKWVRVRLLDKVVLAVILDKLDKLLQVPVVVRVAVAFRHLVMVLALVDRVAVLDRLDKLAFSSLQMELAARRVAQLVMPSLGPTTFKAGVLVERCMVVR